MSHKWFAAAWPLPAGSIEGRALAQTQGSGTLGRFGESAGLCPSGSNFPSRDLSLAIPTILIPSILWVVFVPLKMEVSDDQLHIKFAFRCDQKAGWSELESWGNGEGVFRLQFANGTTFQIALFAFPRDQRRHLIDSLKSNRRAERPLAVTKASLDAQERLVSRMRMCGVDSGAAQSLLRSLRDVVALHSDDVERFSAELAMIRKIPRWQLNANTLNNAARKLTRSSPP